MLRTLVLAVFLIAWLATGIISGVVMGRRHDRLLDRFLWLLFGAASGALIVPLALGAGRREETAAAAPSGGSSTGTKGRRADRDNCATPDRPDQGRAAGAERSSAERARHRPRGRARVLSGK
jgi:hypothetical protein